MFLWTRSSKTLARLSAMAFRASILAAFGAAVVSASCPDGETCAATDAQSLLQVAQARAAVADEPFNPSKVLQNFKLGGAKDDEDPDAKLVGKAVDFKPAPPYSGSEMEVFGEVWITSSEGLCTSTKSQRMYWRLVNVDPGCEKGPGNAPWSCVIRITSGNVCKGGTSASLYNTTARAMDPWLTISYTSQEEMPETAAPGSTSTTPEPVLAERGRARYSPYSTKLSVRAQTGLDAAEIENQTVVVHGFDGRPMACATILKAGHRPSPYTMYPQKGKPLMAQHFSRIGGTPRSVWGYVTMYEIHRETIPHSGYYMTWDLEDVDIACDKGPDPSNPRSCAIRITQGESCSTPDIAPLYVSAERLRNPWDFVGYTAVQGLHVVVARSTGVPVLTGTDSPQALDKSVIVFDHAGNPIACALLDFAN
mmetsp:Transcript_10343/g.29467  ORF Transcript_10343/g.29467 Transcript_10343/m.29467 type:complete len:422 (+) Transcript_10343:29-1294(+)